MTNFLGLFSTIFLVVLVLIDTCQFLYFIYYSYNWCIIHLILLFMAVLDFVAPAINLGVGLLNRASQKSTNDADKAFSEHMYNRQRADSLSDFDMQNLYNSPRMQMQRLQEAGLNPNMVYGTGVQAAGTASSPRASSAPSWSPKAPNLEVGPIVNSYFDIRQRSAQLEILDEQAKQAKLTTESMAIDLGFKPDNALSQSTRLQQEVMEAGIRINMTRDQSYILAKTMQSTIDKAKADLDLTRANIGRTTSDANRIKQDTVRIRLENDLRKKGINPNDPVWMRLIGRIVSDMGFGTIGSLFK